MNFACNFLSLTVMVLLFSNCDRNNTYFVKPSTLVQGYHGAITQHEAFKKKAQYWQQRIDSLNTELQVLSQSPISIRTAKEQQILQYRSAIQQQAQQENQRLTQQVLDEVNAYLKQYGKEKDYNFILGATESGNIVYAADGTDITDEVLKGLNAQYDRQHPTAAP